MPIEATTRFVGVEFTDLPWDDAVARIVDATAAAHFTTVVTPNVDHIVRMDRLTGTQLGRAYKAAIDDADFCFCDSRILARLAAFRGTRLPLVAGSDLTATLFADHLNAGDQIAIVGGDDNSIADLARAYPGVTVHQHIPPMRMLTNDSAMAAAACFIMDAKCRFIFVAVGAPQGEILLHRARQMGATRGVGLSIGASIDFLTGRQIRAPRVIQKLGFEWAYRLLTEPTRLWRRYLVDGPRIFAIVMRRGGR